MNSVKKLLAVFLLATAVLAGAYEVILLSDTHYDSQELRFAPGVLSNLKGIKQFLKQRQKISKILDLYRKKSGSCDFTIHCGDIVHGHYKNDDIHRQAIERGIREIADGVEKPVYFICGNHEFTCKDPKNAFENLLSDYLRRQKMEPRDLNYYFAHGKDLFVFLNCDRPDLKMIREAFASHPDSRHTFVATHYPVLPMLNLDGKTFKGSILQKDHKERRELLALLSARNAVVVCGHIHKTTLIEARFPQGRIVQISNCTRPFGDLEQVSDGMCWQRDVLKEKITSGTCQATPEMKEDFAGTLQSFRLFYPVSTLNVLDIDDEVTVTSYTYGGKKVRTMVLKDKANAPVKVEEFVPVTDKKPSENATVSPLPAARRNPEAKRLFLTRHAQRGKKIADMGEQQISKLGRKQAVKMGKRLKDWKFDGMIFASPYLRTMQTAVLAGKEISRPVYPEAALQERVHDNRAGKSGDNPPNLKRGYTLAEYKTMFIDAVAPDSVLADQWLLAELEIGNNRQQERLTAALNDLTKRYPDAKDMLLVLHQSGVHTLVNALLPPEEKISSKRVINCVLVVLERNGDKWRLVGIDDGFFAEGEKTSNARILN